MGDARGHLLNDNEFFALRKFAFFRRSVSTFSAPKRRIHGICCLMKPQICCLTLGIVASIISFSAGNAVSVSAQEPAAKTTVDALLKQFVDDCVQISPGKDPFPATFQMGGGIAGPFAAPAREVPVKQPFRISKFEVTQELYQAVMGTNPSRWKGARNSVEMVSCQEAELFCTRLTAVLQSRKLIAANEKVRLPLETEWEYCCRAGTATRFSFGDSATSDGDTENQAALLNDYAWHTGNAAGNDPVVGSLKPNPWGLYDMHGYLWEFVSDPYAATSSEAGSRNDETTPAATSARIIRGGSWRDHHSLLTSDFRLTLPTYAASDAIGFRCVIAP